MKKQRLTILILCAALLLAACGKGKANMTDSITVPTITVSSSSITEGGRLLTACAADKAPNDPMGENQSPALSWQAVSGAACYAVVMFDTDANWLHWLAVTRENTLDLGAYGADTGYTGPYPPTGTGRHSYRIEVFALAQDPGSTNVKLDSAQPWEAVVDSLDKADGEAGNILARGYVTGTYEHGDDTA